MDAVLVELLTVATFIAFFASVLIEVVKKALPTFPAKYLPILALFLGAFIGFLAYVSFDLGTSLAYMLWGGAIAGLASVGFFESAIKPMYKSSK